MNELNPEQEAILAECLQAMEGGQGLEACLARFSEQAHALRPFLHLHAEMLEFEPPEPAPFVYQAGREALLARIIDGPAVAASAGLRTGLAGVAAKISHAWTRRRRALRTPAAQGTAVAVLVLVFGGSALGASAAAGFQPSQDVLSSLGMTKGSDETRPQHVEDDDKGAGVTPNDTKTAEPGDKTPISVVVPSKSPTPEKPVGIVNPEPTDKPAAAVSPTKQPERAKASPTRVPVPTVPGNPTPIAVDLEGVCIPVGAYQQYTRLHAYDVRVCSQDQVAWLHEAFLKGLCLPKDVADQYPSMTDLQITTCSHVQEKLLQQHLFVEGWCAPTRLRSC